MEPIDRSLVDENAISALLKADKKHIWHPFTQMQTAGLPIAITRGKGTLLFDEDGNGYIDAISSWWVNLHGHGNEYIARKIYEQLQTLEHVIFAGFTHPPAVQLARRLIPILPENQAKLFFSDNGSTAVEVAIKLAIQYFFNQGIKRNKLIAFEGGYHGDTFGAMSAGADVKFNAAFADYFFEVAQIPAPVRGKEEEVLGRLKQLLANNDVYAFIFEPLIQGAAGMVMYEPAILDHLMTICKEHGVLCIADEVMTGFGRTGRFFASDYLQEQPDLICLSKGLTGGTLPMSVTSCTQNIFEGFLSLDHSKTFFHGHSFTGNPVGCAAALASLDLLEREDCMEKINRISLQHQQFVAKWQKHPALADLRCCGTILAAEFKTGEETSYFNSIRDQLYQFFLDRGVILRPLGNVIYVMPPYCITEKELQKVYLVIEEAMEKFITAELPQIQK